MTQIKATLLTGGNHIETVSFPCSDDEIMRLTEQNEIGHKATGLINNLIGPKGLKSMEGTYANIHELNYLAKRMDSFDGTEMGKLLASASRFDTLHLQPRQDYCHVGCGAFVYPLRRKPCCIAGTAPLSEPK